jgi:hypothetical protein
MDIAQFDISVALTCHREGLLAGMSVKSAIRCIHEASRIGLKCELLLILDRSDALTKETVQEALGSSTAVILETSFGDPALSRNQAAQTCQGMYLSYLDADDLWSYNWLTSSWLRLQKEPAIIAHSQCNVVFGDRNDVWWHVDSESPDFDPDYLVWSNYWDALSFAKADTYRTFPFRPNDLEKGFGHEDWLWNHHTLMAGLSHRPVDNTIHFKRARIGSQMSKINDHGNLTWPDVQKDWLARRARIG